MHQMVTVPTTLTKPGQAARALSMRHHAG
jgi:hypothetical protein